MFDLAASAIGGVGLLYIDASSNQMLRGSGVVFTALLARCMLRQRLSGKQWGGILAVVGGLALVGMCGMFRASDTLAAAGAVASSHNKVSPAKAALGLVLVLAGSALNSVQNVLEEKLVKAVGSNAVAPLELVGWEGLWGTLVCALALLPIVNAIPGSNCGSVESASDTWQLLRSSGVIVWLVVGYSLSLAVLNAASVQLSQLVSAVFRQLINAMRVVLVWLFGLALWYWWTHRSMGEGWDRYSFLQLGGFVLLIAGTLLYGTQRAAAHEEEPLPVPDLSRDDEEEEERKRREAEQRAAQANIEEGVDTYDDEGNRIDPSASPPASHPIHIGNGRAKKRSSKPVARSPGVELPVPDIREPTASSSSSSALPSARASVSSRRAQADIRLEAEEPPEL